MKNITTTETTAVVCFNFGSVATVGVTLYEGLSIDECIALRSEDIEEYKIAGGEWTTRKATAEEARQHLAELRNDAEEQTTTTATADLPAERLNKSNKHSLKAGDALHFDYGDSYIITSVISNGRNVSFTLQDKNNGRCIYGYPSSECYGAKIIRANV